LRLPVVVVAVFVVAAVELVAELEGDEELLLEEPHPASVASAAQTASVARRRLICAPTLA
jgi:hypothetical protein